LEPGHPPRVADIRYHRGEVGWSAPGVNISFLSRASCPISRRRQCTAVRLVYSRIVSLPFSKLLQKLTTKATNLAGGDGPWLRRKRSRARRPRMRRLELDAAVAVLRAGIAAGQRLRAGDLVGRGPTTSRAEAEPR